MSKKLLKNIDWIITVPNKDDIRDANIDSTKFSIERNEKITTWKLFHNFNDRETEHFAAYLRPEKPYEISFDVDMTFIVLDWTDVDANKSKIIKKPRLGKDWKTADGWGEEKLISHEELFREQSRFVKDGKLQLIVAVREKDIAEVKDEEEHKIQVQFEKTFKAMISENLRDGTIILQTSDGVQLSALKQIITDKSPVFAAMLRGVVKILDFSGKVMEELLRFLYIGKVKSIEEVDMELYEVAKVYQIGKLGDICLASIESRVDLSNVFEVLEFAYVQDDHLFDTCSEIICRFFDIPKIQEKIKELEKDVQNRLLTHLAKLSRYNHHVFCSVVESD